MNTRAPLWIAPLNEETAALVAEDWENVARLASGYVDKCKATERLLTVAIGLSMGEFRRFDRSFQN